MTVHKKLITIKNSSQPTIAIITGLHKVFVCCVIIPDFCEAGKYVVTTSTGKSICVPCPANSVSIAAKSHLCSCFLGYYRNEVEDIHVPCTSKFILFQGQLYNLKMKFAW